MGVHDWCAGPLRHSRPFQLQTGRIRVVRLLESEPRICLETEAIITRSAP